MSSIERETIKLKRKYRTAKTRGGNTGGENPAPKKHRNKNPKAHTGTQRNLVLVLNRQGKFVWREV